MPNPAIMRLFKDDDSHTGMSAAILIRNIRPKRLASGRTVIANANFTANFTLNCEGFRVKPRVKAVIECQLSEIQAKTARKKRIMDRALAGSPMLK